MRSNFIIRWFKNNIYGNKTFLSILNPQYTYDTNLDKFVKTFLNSKKLNGKVILDVGCGHKPYRVLNDDTIWLGLDTSPNSLRDFNYKENSFYPIKNQSIDLVICTEVLEHVENDKFLVEEIYRCLKIDGTAIFTTPFLFPLHGEPQDFRRLTPFGLESMFISKKVLIKTGLIGGPCSSIILLILNLITPFFFKRKSAKLLIPVYFAFNLLCNVLAIILDKFLKNAAFGQASFAIITKVD